MTRVSQLAQQMLTLRSLLDSQGRVQDAQIQIATSRRGSQAARPP